MERAEAMDGTDDHGFHTVVQKKGNILWSSPLRVNPDFPQAPQTIIMKKAEYAHIKDRHCSGNDDRGQPKTSVWDHRISEQQLYRLAQSVARFTKIIPCKKMTGRWYASLHYPHELGWNRRRTKSTTERPSACATAGW